MFPYKLTNVKLNFRSDIALLSAIINVACFLSLITEFNERIHYFNVAETFNIFCHNIANISEIANIFSCDNISTL